MEEEEEEEAEEDEEVGTLVDEDGGEGVKALAVGVAASPQLRRRVWLHDNSADEASVEEAARLLVNCGIQELLLTAAAAAGGGSAGGGKATHGTALA